MIEGDASLAGSQEEVLGCVAGVELDHGPHVGEMPDPKELDDECPTGPGFEDEISIERGGQVKVASLGALEIGCDGVLLLQHDGSQ